MIPAIEGLLYEPYNSHLLTLLYRLAEWHALAKLRMHTEYTLAYLDKATATIGQGLRFFREWTRTAYTCKELPREVGARSRRLKKGKATADKASVPTALSQKAKGKAKSLEPKASSKTGAEAKVKLFNLAIYKFHALGDYVRTIRLFGTTDSYSTQIVRSLEQIHPRFDPILPG
jgi:hypothetical protein